MVIRSGSSLSFLRSQILNFSDFQILLWAFRLRRRAFRCIFARYVFVPPLIPSHNLRFRSRIQDSAGSQRMPLQSLTRVAAAIKDAAWNIRHAIN